MKYLVILFCYIICCPIQAQFGLEDFKHTRRIDLPFDYKNNLILVKVNFDKKLPLTFIFDTGAEHTILAKRQVTDLLRVPYEREFQLLGSDMTTRMTAYLVRDIHLKIGELVIPKQPLLVLEEDYFQFEELLGMDIHGILGADIFKRFIVGINYSNKIISLFNPVYFKRPGKGFDIFDIEINKNKPYATCHTTLHNDQSVTVKLLIDTGASIPLILNTNTHVAIQPPPKVISGKLGMGLGGYLEGFMGRVEKLNFGKKPLENVLTYYQELPELLDSAILNGRNGIIGNQILDRYEVMIDYYEKKLYLKPNKRFKKKFDFDKSGIVLLAGGKGLDDFFVHDLIKDSPSDLAGMQAGDQIVSVKGIPATFLSLSDLYRIFRKKEGKKVKLVVKRKEERVKISFRLRNLI